MEIEYIILWIFCILGNLIMWAVLINKGIMWGVVALIPFFIWLFIMDAVVKFAECTTDESEASN